MTARGSWKEPWSRKLVAASAKKQSPAAVVVMLRDCYHLCCRNYCAGEAIELKEWNSLLARFVGSNFYFRLQLAAAANDLAMSSGCAVRNDVRLKSQENLTNERQYFDFGKAFEEMREKYRLSKDAERFAIAGDQDFAGALMLSAISTFVSS